MDGARNSPHCLRLLSSLLLSDDKNLALPMGGTPSRNPSQEEIQTLAEYGHEDCEEILGLASSHHVVMRTLPELHRVMVAEGIDWAERVGQVLEKERARIHHALSFLPPICRALEEVGEVIVIKSLDHWPDLGCDFDLYTNAEAIAIIGIMKERFNARAAARSWGDRLANKWNFVVHGLPELVEVHAGRLGQTGEQVAITASLVSRASVEQFGSHSFRVPAAEGRLIISTLQRMYRHFYLRLCDVVDTARLVQSGAVDFDYLPSLARSAGLWDGLATYLLIVSEYVQSYRGEGLPLPALVTNAARFGNERVRFRRRFLRIPIFPQAASLYVSEWEKLLRNGEMQNTLRLSLLPGLAAAAALGLKFAGRDKGIW